MKRLAVVFPWVLVAALMAWVLWPRSPTVSLSDAADAARAGGDSAVTAYRSQAALDAMANANAALADSLARYQAKARVVAKVVVTRDTVTVRDTVWLAATTSADTSTGDTATVVVPPAVADGVEIHETLRVTPATARVQRASLSVVIHPDTLALALLRLPNGLDRLVAVGGPDTRARVLDAAQVRPGPSTAQKALTWATRALAVYGGFRLGRDLLSR
jgi:hypothetical protein